MKHAARSLQDVLDDLGVSSHFDSPPSSVNEVGGWGDPPIIIVVSWNEPEVIKLLAANHADVNFPGDMKNTALHKAALLGLPDVVDALLSCGADCGMTNAEGETALDIAASRQAASQDADNHRQVVELLKRATILRQ